MLYVFVNRRVTEQPYIVVVSCADDGSTPPAST
jgi:hypothetical protein